MYRIWYSTESLADYFIDHTRLARLGPVVKARLYESDASNPRNFHTMPDHIRRILYLDAPDLIVERDDEPVFSVEVTTEAGTGHNAFQRFARIAAAVENGVPAFYIYPEAVIIERKRTPPRWDKINPAVFAALEAVMQIYEIPALLYYFPSDFLLYSDCTTAPHRMTKGLRYDPGFRYAGCPDCADSEMKCLFEAVDELLDAVERDSVRQARREALKKLSIRARRGWMQAEYHKKAAGRPLDGMSPLSAVRMVPTAALLDYLSRYEGGGYRIGQLLRGRRMTALYQVNAKFRGDPYPGALAAIDYLRCREGPTFEDRRHNLALVFGEAEFDPVRGSLSISGGSGATIEDFFAAVQSCERHNLLTQSYGLLRPEQIPRYLMQVRYGSTYSKVKHIRVYSYFSDAILFPDGALWRDG